MGFPCAGSAHEHDVAPFGEELPPWSERTTSSLMGVPSNTKAARSLITGSLAAVIIVPPRSTAVPSEAAETAPTQRDRHLRAIVEHGRMAWQAASGYTKRARAETAMSRFKRVIGDGLRSHADDRRATEVEVAVHVLNRMLDLGRPKSVRIA